jgi:sensor domain CHASE-containing protein
MKKESKLPRFSGWIFSNPKLTGLLLFTFLIFTVGYIVSRRYAIIKENEEREMSNILQVVQQNINQNLKNCYTTTLALSLTINDENQPENFDYVGKKLLESNPFIDAVQLVPDGIIKHIYPLKGNEPAMGFDIFNSKVHQKDALESIKNHKMYFAGPVELKQGGIGIVGRLPVFKNDKFWGFSAIVIRLKTLLNASGINSIDDSKYYFQFSSINPNSKKEEFFLSNKVNFRDRNFEVLRISDSNWKIYLINKNKYEIIVDILPSSTLGFLFSFFLSLFIFSLLKKPAELQLLVHSQPQICLTTNLNLKLFFSKPLWELCTSIL